VTYRPRILRTPRQRRRRLLNPAARARAEELLVEMEELQKTLPHGL
jgi:hypothetical protein